MAKKLTFSLIIVILFLNRINAQVASIDAVSLKPYAQNGARLVFMKIDSLKVLPILLNYIGDNNIKSFKDLKKLFSNNPFIDVEGNVDASIESEITSIGQGAVNSVLSTPITTAADGAVKFLIKRAKQELLISFINNLQDSSKYPEFRILFPSTKTLLDNFNSWEYPNIINSLREAFDKDIKQLMGDILNLNSLNLKDGNYSSAARKRDTAIKIFFKTEEGRLFISALQIGNGFTTGQKIPDIIHTIAGIDYLAGLSTLTADERNTIRLLDILSYSIRSNSYGKSYINASDFNSLLNDVVEKNIYLGLLWQQLYNEHIAIAQTDSWSLLTPANFISVNNFINSLISESQNLSNAFVKLSAAKKKGETDLSTYWGAIFENANQFFQSTINLQSINPLFRFPDKFQKALNLSTNTLEIAQDIASKNYNAAIVATLNFITQNLKTGDDISGFKSFFVKYGSFAANVIQAKNSDDVESAIESVALPAGSASIKKQSTFNIALNAYLGGFYGWENLEQKQVKPWSAISGVYAPIGVTFSLGVNKKGTKCGVYDFFTKGASLSALINIIDIGAFASYRLQDDSTAKLPNVTLQNILAPGFGIIYGFPKWPISIGYTYQLGPALRDITASTVTTTKPNYRGQFFLAVDIPLLNFYTRSKADVNNLKK